ncbi:MAG: 50S ribosomal protein L10 [Chloroflexi bacterium RBG_16_57_9]|nr:MAG: 50S ribosomal protein L10 [Chloroflexi bacterium RBG_16_57_9]
MAISKEKKAELVSELTELFKKSQAVILTEYRGLSVADIQKLRNQLRQQNTGFRVAKNTLTRIALQQTGLPVPDKLLKGPTALAFLFEDLAGPTKTLTDYARTSGGNLTIKGGIVGDSIVDEKEVASLATLPSREVLLAHVLGAIQGPMASLVGLLTAPQRELVYILQQRGEGAQVAATSS